MSNSQQGALAADELVELSVGRDPDGDVNFEIYVNRHNLVSVSVASDGAINWAGIIEGKSYHGTGSDHYPMGELIFRLLNSRVEDADNV